MIISSSQFIVWTMACGLSPNFTAFLFFRLLSGCFGSAPIAVVMGIMADIFGDPVTRGRAMAIFMAVGGPVHLLHVRGSQSWS